MEQVGNMRLFSSTFQMPESKRKAMVNVISKLKQQVVWRWETEMPDQPSNLFLHKWLPQQDILGHPNTRMFVTHGGQSSLQEAWCHKVPTVVLSVFGDQDINGQDVERLATGKKMNFCAPTVDLSLIKSFQLSPHIVSGPLHSLC